MYSYGPPHMAGQKQDDQHEYTFSSYVRIRDVALKTCQRRWTIGRSSERGSGISVLVARHDDIYIYIYIYIYWKIGNEYYSMKKRKVFRDWSYLQKYLQALTISLFSHVELILYLLAFRSVEGPKTDTFNVGKNFLQIKPYSENLMFFIYIYFHIYIYIYIYILCMYVCVCNFMHIYSFSCFWKAACVW